MKLKTLMCSLFLVHLVTVAQDEEDYSIYDNLEYADESSTTFVSPKIIGLSPNRFINVQPSIQFNVRSNDFLKGSSCPFYSSIPNQKQETIPAVPCLKWSGHHKIYTMKNKIKIVL